MVRRSCDSGRESLDTELDLSTSCVRSIVSWPKKNVPASKSGPARTGPAGPCASPMMRNAQLENSPQNLLSSLCKRYVNTKILLCFTVQLNYVHFGLNTHVYHWFAHTIYKSNIHLTLRIVFVLFCSLSLPI